MYCIAPEMTTSLSQSQKLVPQKISNSQNYTSAKILSHTVTYFSYRSRKFFCGRKASLHQALGQCERAKRARDPLRTPLEQAKGKLFSHVLVLARFF